MLRYLLGWVGPSGFGSGTPAIRVAERYADRCAGRTFVITGANTGIGKESARVLALKGAHVIMACRSADRMAAAARDIETEVAAAPPPEGASRGRVTQEVLDLASMASIRAFAGRVVGSGAAVNVLLCNAGVMMCPASATAEDYELQFGSNTLGHWLLTELLRPALNAASKPGDPARVVLVASEAHNFARGGLGDVEAVARLHKSPAYGPVRAYANSKLGNMLHAREFNRRERLTGTPKIVAFALHPGVIDTELLRHINPVLLLGYKLGRPMKKSVPQGAATQVFLCLAPEADPAVPYWADCNPCACKPYALDDAKAKEMWDWCAAAAARPPVAAAAAAAGSK